MINYFEDLKKDNINLINKIIKKLNNILETHHEYFDDLREADIAKNVASIMEKDNDHPKIKYKNGIKEVILNISTDQKEENYQLNTLVFEKTYRLKTSEYQYQLKTICLSKYVPEKDLKLEVSLSNHCNTITFENDDLDIRSYFTLFDGYTDLFHNEKEKEIPMKHNLEDYLKNVIEYVIKKENSDMLKEKIYDYLNSLNSIFYINNSLENRVSEVLFEGKHFTSDELDLLNITHDINIDNNNLKKYLSSILNTKLKFPKKEKQKYHSFTIIKTIN